MNNEITTGIWQRSDRQSKPRFEERGSASASPVETFDLLEAELAEVMGGQCLDALYTNASCGYISFSACC